ncbi:hypothetical protein GGI01_003252 [Coemansia sp. RSA 376]|nr:hypothetical protein GGI01_003252 [Coemansia sp. RSA 376]
MLTFYVVDPSTRIPSTEIVPPQQQDWWSEDLLSSEPLGSLPQLIMGGIMDMVDYPISLKNVKRLRQDMTSQYECFVGDISYHDYEPWFDYGCTIY